MPDIKQRAHKMFDERFIPNRGVTQIVTSLDDGSDSYENINDIKSFIDEIIDIAVAERDKEIRNIIDDEYKRGDTPVVASGRCRYAKMTETLGESRARQSGWLSGLLTVKDKILKPKLSAEALNIK